VDRKLPWYLAVDRGCKALAKPNDVDIVMATGGPFGSFPLARRLSRRLKCPYVLDYRDLWGGNPTRTYGDRLSRFEIRVLRECSAVAVWAPSMAAWLSAQAPVAQKLNVIPNGYDPEQLEL
jgi:glycosyltransferase involved in cell wall biosynthesis